MDTCKHRIRLLCDRNRVGVGYGVIIRSLKSWTKSVKNFVVSYPQNAYPADWVPLWLLSSPHPGQSCLVEVRNYLNQEFNSIFWGNGECSDLSCQCFENLVLKLDMMVTLVTTLIFYYFSLSYNCFNDCSYDFTQVWCLANKLRMK